MSLSQRTFTNDDQLKLRTVITEGVRIKREAKDVSEGFSDTVKHIAKELDIKPALINATVAAALKDNLEEQKENLDGVEELLEIARI